ncbi:elmoB [Acrasis kona]|uniref:ElmoB n=1 Tax=Acrasis kona TaxID=1008807 RepID=A0AAW2YVM1_9EUKA
MTYKDGYTDTTASISASDKHLLGTLESPTYSHDSSTNSRSNSTNGNHSEIHTEDDLPSRLLTQLLDNSAVELKDDWTCPPTPQIFVSGKLYQLCCSLIGSFKMKDVEGYYKPGCKLQDRYEEELKRYIALSRISFDHSNVVHQQIVCTYYRHILPNDKEGISPNRSSSKRQLLSCKWEKIGFLGPDLNTEFRGVGIFGAIMLLYLSTYYEDFLKHMFETSNEPGHSFPLSISILHILNTIIHTIKSGHMNEFINNKKSSLTVIQLLLVSICEHFIIIWRRGNYVESEFHTVIHNKIEEAIETEWVDIVKAHVEPTNKKKLQPDTLRMV